MFIPIWGRFPFWLIFFQMGWNSLQVPSTSIHFHPLPARLGDLETTVISLAMEGQFRFQVPAIAFLLEQPKEGRWVFGSWSSIKSPWKHGRWSKEWMDESNMKASVHLCSTCNYCFYLYIVVIVCWNTGNTLFWYAPYCDSSDLNVCGQMRIDVKVWVRQFCTKGGGIHTDAALPCGNDPATGRSRSCRGKSGVSLESGFLLFFFVDSSSFMISS